MDTAPYLERAHQLFTRELAETGLAAAVAGLPPLTQPLLARLVAEAGTVGPTRPRHRWAIMAVADAVARQQDDPRLQARAAWELARAANRWFRPGQAIAAAQRAESLFRAVAEPGWVAASIWQAHALPWAHTNFREAVAALEQALAGLSAAGHDDLVPACRRDLGYAYLLVQEGEKGLAELTAVEQVFREREQPLEVGRTLVSKAAALRRLGHFDQALETVAQALALLEQEPDSFDFHFARYRQAAIRTLRGVEYDAAESTLLAIARRFREMDVPLQQAQCYSLLDRLFRETGRLPEAAAALKEARQIYVRFNVLGMRADNFLDSARLALQQGDYERALSYYENARPLYRQLQLPYMVAVTLMYQGETYGTLGRYQQALATLEEALGRFEEMGDDYRRTECSLYLAGIWLRLARPKEALAVLEPATASLLAAGRTFFLAELYSARAEAHFRQGQGEKALALLQEAAGRLPAGDLQPVLARLQRLQGEILSALQRPAEALPLLESAHRRQQEMGLALSAATTGVSLGECHARLGNRAAARAAWEVALAACRGAEPELVWRAYAGQARLAEDEEAALSAYTQAITALSRLRRWFWQPSVAGAYLHRPLALVDEAITLAARQEDGKQLLAFVEAGKAQTLLRQLTLAEATPTALAVPEQSRELVMEIRWLRQQIEDSVSRTPGFLRPAGERRLRARLQERLEAYEQTFTPLQRRQVRPVAEAVAPRPGTFDLEGWRRQAQAALGTDWVALDYYLAGDTLYGVLLTPDTCRPFTAEADPYVSRILALWTRGRPAAHAWRAGDLDRLGRWLLPAGLAGRLTPGTHLIVVPHGPLHHLPWPALPLPGGGPLVAAAIPLLTPSLGVLGHLWQRALRPVARRDGLLLAVSAFHDGRHEPLPEVKAEAAALAATLGEGGRSLLEREASGDGLQALADEGQGAPGLGAYSFWHIATHAFHDPLAGRLSGIALYERDLWLDELWQLAPLPPLVMLSACSGSRGHFYPGDEQLGLVSTCLAAGAHQVVGSLWPILDPAASTLTAAFYRHFYAGATPARALAHAQREALFQGRPLAEWAPFLCTGAPFTYSPDP